jgi:hypothetical protein
MAFLPCLRGVDVAADVEAVLGDVVAGQAAGYLLLGLEGADAALADWVHEIARQKMVTIEPGQGA